MRILMVGAGALGGFVGACLTRAGEELILLESNPARARLLNDAGLIITQTGKEEVSVPVRVVTSVADLAPFDLIFIAVKTYQTAEAVRAVQGVAGPATWFLSMQNGIGNAEAIAGLVGAERVLCGVTYHSIQHAGPARLNYRIGIKPMQIAPLAGQVTPEIEAIAEVFRHAGLDTIVAPNIDHVLWQKLLHNAAINPVSAVTGLTCREILADDDLIAFTRDLTEEILAVMRARGVPIVDPEDPFRPILGSLKALGKNRPSMWQDLSRGTRTEVDAINGAIVAEAARHGLAAPHNAALVRFIHSRERHKFLNRQAIAVRLGLESGPGEAAGSPSPPARPNGTPARSDSALPGRDSPLESTRRLKELLHGYYRDLAEAGPSHRRVAACSALAPVEIVRSLDVLPYFPENHAALIAARRQAAPYIGRATAAGFSPFASSAMGADIGALLEGTSPLAAAHGIAGPPRPDLAVYSTNTGPELTRWFEFYGDYYRVPVIGLHPAPVLEEVEPADFDAAVHQLGRFVSQIEQATGRTLNQDRLAEVVGYTAQAAALWDEILSLARAVPAPFTYFDTLVHLAPMVLLRGTPEAVAYYQGLKTELEDRVARLVAAVPEESYRFYWDGPPIWGALRPLARLFADAGAAIVASTFAGIFALPGLDPDNPLASLAQAYLGVFPNRSAKYQAAFLALQFEQYGVDGAIYHDCRTAPHASQVRHSSAVRVPGQTGVPGLVIESDSHDPRLFSLERLEGQLAEFLERQIQPMAGSIRG